MALFCSMSPFYSLVRVGNSLFGFSCESLVFMWAKEQNSNSLFSKSKSFQSLFKKEWGRDSFLGITIGKVMKNCQTKTWWKQQIFLSKSLVFWEGKSKRAKVWFALKISANHSHLSLLKRDHEWIAAITLFLKIGESDLLTVNLFYRVTRANPSWSLYKESNFEWKSEEWKSKRANSQP